MTSRTKASRTFVLPPRDERAGFVRSQFGEIAARYDLFNDVSSFGLHRLWKRRTITESGLRYRPNVCVLDLCSGTGDLAISFSRALGTESQVTALDFSREMLDVLRARLASGAAPLPVEVIEGDATNLPFADASFDAVSIGFGLRNIPNRQKCLSEIARVLRPGGRALILDVGKVRMPLVSLFHRFYFETIVPWMGRRLDPANAAMYAYLPASAREFPSPEELRTELAAAGLSGGKIVNFLFGAAALITADKRT
ncbi:MAG: bifunctional demethylmenaquinone methyltransferase/2-methoxy-6-polyprenyl-1,4-benzoquinol methylase UbiE [Spirochaetia bacterium]|nr:bifunctional demethylmenaquinone methyltransferase/2-methoxy-6-polyprenyl-1,4-benzoquinol methylase UbiE [Spirochaetia bacterium]